jgi:hypothetical protein
MKGRYKMVDLELTKEGATTPTEKECHQCKGLFEVDNMIASPCDESDEFVFYCDRCFQESLSAMFTAMKKSIKNM